MIAMGKTRGLTLVAEGVDTAEHACDEIQGYYSSKPIADDALAELLQHRTKTSEREREKA